MKVTRALLVVLLSSLAAVFGFGVGPLWAATAPPVRIAIVAGSASGMEQEAVDRLTDQLQSNPDIKVSTVNPDWTTVISIVDKTDTLALTVRVNGTYTVKTRDGHVIATDSVQTNKQDWNTSPGTPAPINRVLADSAARETIDKLVERAVNPINDAVTVEMGVRKKIIQANGLADQDKYAEGIDILKTIEPDTPHFRAVRDLMDEFAMEQSALDLMNSAKSDAHAGRLSRAIGELSTIDKKSKRYSTAKAMIAQLRRQLASRSIKSAPAGGSASEVKALEAQKRALDAQKKAIEAQETAIKLKSKPNK